MSQSLQSNKTYSESNIQNNESFAEIIQSNLLFFTAQCWVWDNFPEFGSLVQTQSDKKIVLGCVTQIETGSLDPMRSPFPYQKTEAELMAEQPQIFEFLRTTFNVQIIGYIDENTGEVNQRLAPTPCKIHSFVKKSPNEIVAKFFKEPNYINILFASQGQNSNLEELLLAILKNLENKHMLTQKTLDDFCQTFSLLTGNDYRRLKLFLKRIKSE